MSQLIRKTRSVCPVCLKIIPASVFRMDSDVFMKKSCPEHGSYKTIVWRGDNPSYEQWSSGYSPKREIRIKGAGPVCLDDCGLCPAHLQKTCCALVEVTQRCNLNCPVCFADCSTSPEPDITQLELTFRRLVSAGNSFVQLSGGEPTVRDDLPQIVAAARDAGCVSIQLNSNGIRLAEDPLFVKLLADNGLSFVFLQFDGTNDLIYSSLRGRALLDIKKRAIDNCASVNLGVTLVPTISAGVNTHNIGDIIDFGLSQSPAVRGIHFQPMSFFGRYPHIPNDTDRVTLPEILRSIESQTHGKFKIKDFLPSRCDHPYCGFHGDFAVLPNKAIMKLTPKNPKPCCDDGNEHIKNRQFVARRWKREQSTPPDQQVQDYSDMTAFLNRIKSHGFTITAMAFQDALNLDIDRLRRCSLHVVRGEKLVPFCARYISMMPI